MPVFEIEDPRTQKVIRIEADREPTEEEALEAFSAFEPSPTPLPSTSRTGMLPEEEVFSSRFTAEQQAPIATAARQLAGVLPALAETVVEGGAGLGEILGEASVAPTTAPRGLREAVSEAVATSVFPGLAGFRGTIGRALPALSQTALEVVPRESFNLLEMGRQLGRFGIEEPGQIGDVVAGQLTGGLPGAITAALRSRTPTPEEASRAFERQVATQAAQEVAAEPIAPEVFGEANIPLAQAIPVVAGAVPVIGEIPALTRAAGGAITGTFEAIAAPIQRAVSRGFRTPTIEKATGLVGVTESEGLRDLLSVATPRIIQKSGKTPRNAKEAIQAANQAEKGLIDEAQGFLKVAEDQGLAMKGDEAVGNAMTALRERHPSITADEIENIVSEYEFLGGDINPTQGQKFLVEQNDKLTAFRQKEGISARAARANPEITARLAVADTLSDQLDDLVKVASGKNVSPYRDWGQVREFKSGVQDSVKRAERALGRDALPAGGEGEAVVPLTRFGAAGRVLRKVSRPIRKQATEFVDDAVNSVFKESKKTFAEPQLPANTISSIQRNYVRGVPPALPRSATPPTVPSVAAPAVAQAAVPTFEEQIQAIIRTYPASLRRDPRLARIAAEAELGEAAAPAMVQAVVPATVPSQSLQQAISEVSTPPVAPTGSAVAPVPVRTYPPEIQAQLDEMAAEASAYRRSINERSIPQSEKNRLLKGFGMRQAAEKRQLTGELTGIEAARKAAREAGNYIGKPVSINLGGQTVPAEVVGNPFGRVKVRLQDGREITVLPENIGPNLQQAIEEAVSLPTRPTQAPTVLPRAIPPQELYQEMLRAIERGDIFTAQKISDQLKGL